MFLFALRYINDRGLGFGQQPARRFVIICFVICHWPLATRHCLEGVYINDRLSAFKLSYDINPRLPWMDLVSVPALWSGEAYSIRVDPYLNMLPAFAPASRSTVSPLDLALCLSLFETPQRDLFFLTIFFSRHPAQFIAPS